MAEVGVRRTAQHDPPYRARLADRAPPHQPAGGTAAHLPAQERIRSHQQAAQGGPVAAEVVSEQLGQTAAHRNVALPAALADPGDEGRGSVEVQITDPEGDQLGDPYPGQAESEDQLVATPGVRGVARP